MLKIRCRKDFEDYCQQHNLLIKDFNEPIEILNSVNNYSRIFAGCSQLKTTVKLPINAEDKDTFDRCHGKYDTNTKIYSYKFKLV